MKLPWEIPGAVIVMYFPPVDQMIPANTNVFYALSSEERPTLIIHPKSKS